MIGLNTFMLNEETLIEALQEYLDRRFVQNLHIEVTGVSSEKYGVAGTELFKVEILGKEKDAQG